MKRSKHNRYITKLYESKIMRFLVVGASSTLIELVLLYVLVEYGQIDLFIAIIIVFVVAVIHSFVLNKIWTFGDTSGKYKRLFVKFLIVSSVWFVLTLFWMYVFTILLGIYYIFSKILTTVLVVIWNFLWNKMWTFRHKPIKKLKDKHSLKYSIIIPAYNEQDRIGDTLNKISHYFEKLWKTYEILVIDDGSSDNTKQVVLSANIPKLELLSKTKNYGKGSSVKRWMMKARGKYLLFTDADNSTPIEELDKLMQYISEYDIVIGSRFTKNSNIKQKQPWYRVFIGRGWNFLIKNFLFGGISDTQCGFKLFKRKAALDIFPLQKIKGFGFDMEILLIALSKGYTIKEVGVVWINSEFSRVRPIKDGIKTLGDLIYIKLNYWFDGYN